MGCDIHMNVEVRRDGRWTFVEPPIVHESWNSDPAGRQTWWDDRSYVTFAVLAGVRADPGVPPPIDEPRGYPDDADPETLISTYPAPRGQNHGDHSASWLTLDEVLAHDWEVKFQEEGVVSLREYLACQREKRTPKSWSRWVSGKTTTVRSVTETEAWLKTTAGRMEALATLTMQQADQWYPGESFVKMKWTARLRDRCASFLAWARSLPEMLDAAPADIRLVFSFDS